jgi:hypothetical protein
MAPWSLVVDPLYPVPAELPPNLWDRWPGEPTLWYDRFFLFLRQPPGRRSIIETIRTAGLSPNARTDWERKGYPRRWYWRPRAEAYDQHVVEEQIALRDEVMTSGYALEYQRVRALARLGEREERLLHITGEHMERDPEAKRSRLGARYSMLKSAFDSTLRQIAEETGGRVRRVSVQRDLEDYARQLAIERGYDIDDALALARMVVSGHTPTFAELAAPSSEPDDAAAAAFPADDDGDESDPDEDTPPIIEPAPPAAPPSPPSPPRRRGGGRRGNPRPPRYSWDAGGWSS